MGNDSKCSVVQNMFYLPKIRALASPLHVFCPHCMPFFTFSSVFHTLLDLFQTWRLFLNIIFIFSYEWSIFFIHSTIHSICCGKIFIQKNILFFREALFKFKISFIQNNAVLFIQKIYSFFWKVAYRTGLPPLPIAWVFNFWSLLYTCK